MARIASSRYDGFAHVRKIRARLCPESGIGGASAPAFAVGSDRSRRLQRHAQAHFGTPFQIDGRQRHHRHAARLLQEHRQRQDDIQLHLGFHQGLPLFPAFRQLHHFAQRARVLSIESFFSGLLKRFSAGKSDEHGPPRHRLKQSQMTTKGNDKRPDQQVLTRASRQLRHAADYCLLKIHCQLPRDLVPCQSIFRYHCHPSEPACGANRPCRAA